MFGERRENDERSMFSLASKETSWKIFKDTKLNKSVQEALQLEPVRLRQECQSTEPIGVVMQEKCLTFSGLHTGFFAYLQLVLFQERV